MKEYIVTVFVGLAVAVFFLPTNSFALTVGPTKLEYTVDPGVSVT